jgi:tetratricopeptide (TPR) repeat protein
MAFNIGIGGQETTCQTALARYNSGMGELTSAKRQVKPWVVIVAVATAVVVFGGIWLVVGNMRLRRVFGRPHHVKVHHSKEWRSTNSLCYRLNRVGCQFAAAGKHDSALTYFREAARLALSEGITDRLAASYQDISNEFDYRHMPESVRFYLDAATALNRGSGRKAKVTSSLLEEGTFRLNSGDVDSGKVLLEEVVTLARAAGNKSTEAVALFNLGTLEGTLGHYDSARALLESCAAVSRVIKDQATEVGALGNIAWLCWRRDQLDETKAWLLKAIEAAHAGALFSDEATALYDLALIRADDGDYGLAQVNVQRAMALFQSVGDNGGVDDCRHLLRSVADAQRWQHRQGLDSLLQERRARPGS